MYDSVEEAINRLCNTVVAYDSKPVFIVDVSFDGAIKVYYKALPSYRMPNHHDGISLDDPLLNFRKFKLGYMNCKKNCFYVYRIPIRKYQQGLNKQNTLIENLRDADELDNFDYNLNTFNNVIRFAGFAKMFEGNYPSIKQTLDLLDVDRNKKSVAFSRNFALFKDKTGVLFLQHRNERVGHLNTDSGKVSLGPNYKYLRGKLQRNGVDV